MNAFGKREPPEQLNETPLSEGKQGGTATEKAVPAA
jgi:hypothetical protein